MPAIVLASEAGAHLGFLIVAGDEPISSGHATRDCVLMAPPKQPQDVDHPLVDIIYSERHKERGLVVERQDGLCELTVSISSSTELRLTVPDTGSGTWILQQGEESVRGVCKNASATAG